jgi:Putative Ig domain
MKTFKAALLLLCGGSFLFVLAGCGGGGSTASSTPAPSALSYTSPATATQGLAMTSLSPTVTGTVTAYSVSPALPAGLSLDTTTGRISGTPTVAAAQATYTVTASNATGSTTFAVVLTVLSSTAVSGTAASGAPITGSMNGVVTLKDSSSPAKTVSTTTDSNGKYTFTAAQIQGFAAPFMLEIGYEVAGTSYSLHSAVTAEDVASGNATINITPLTDLVIANLGNEIAAKIFANGNYSSLLTKTALDGGVAALDSLLQPVLAQMGVSASVDLLRQSFTANGQGLDAVLDALQVTVDPSTKSETITNRLSDASVSGTLSAPPTTPLAASTTNNVTDLQAITAAFNSFAAVMATAPSPTSAPLLAFFDQNNFKDDGQNLQTFLQQITTSPVISGGSLAFSDIVLESVPAWVTTVPAGATAYQASFTVLKNKAPSSRHSFIMYATSQGAWLVLGDQLKAKLKLSAFEGDNNGTLCSGVQLNVADKGGIGINYAVVTGPGLPAAGVLLFSTGSSDSLDLAAGDPTTYNGTNTAPATISCSFNNVYVMSDAQIQTVSLPAVYTVKLYEDNGTPGNLSDDILVATYKQAIAAAPLQSAAVTGALFASNISSTPTVVSAAPAGGNVTINWTAPAGSGLYANSLNVDVCNASGCQNVNQDLSGAQTSTTVAVPATAAPITGDGATVEYNDSVFRTLWSTPAGGNF